MATPPADASTSPSSGSLTDKHPLPALPPPKPTPTKKPRQRKQEKSRRPAAAADPRPDPSGPDPHQPSPQLSVPRGPVPQQYPVPPYIMNHPYPMNGANYPTQGQPYQSQPPNPSNGPPIPTHHPGYFPGPGSYHIHPHGYHQYAPQYSSPMMVYPPQRPPPQPVTPNTVSPVPHPPPPPPPPPTTGKRKRKSDATLDASKSKPPDKVSDDEAGADGRSQKSQQAHAQAVVDMRKRTKTQRACDSCRTRKIRCDILVDVERPLCQHCKQYGFECTFILPITETRFKKKKMEEESAERDNPDTKRATASPHADSHRTGDVNVFGPTSTAHLLHSLPSISSRAYESYDIRYHLRWDVSKTGDGLVRVEKPSNDEQKQSLPKPLDMRIERDIIEKLINSYFTDVAPLLPVVTEAEFVSSSSPPPILLYSMCLVAAGRREVPQAVFDSLRFAVNGLLKAEDVLSTASVVNVQALLILCMMGDCHSQFVPSALSALWIRLGTLIRMAQDLGLHRAEAVKQNIELRRRLWGACVISDRWISLTYGHPFMIDVHDCDARLPSSGDPNDRYMDELVRLSIVLGRVLKTIYSPSGLSLTNDEMLHELLRDIDAWKENLPEDLRYRGPESSRSAGLLHLLFSCVCVIFWRVFMRISYSCPAHLKFGLTVEIWSGLVQLTGEAIDWLDAHEGLYDVWLLVAYAATSCAIVQYNTWAKRKDQDAVAKLRKLRDCVRRWEGSLSPDHMSARRNTAEIISLLYEATQSPTLPMEPAVLNPTSGVKVKQSIDGLTYKPDPSRPGGGVFIASKDREEEYKDVVPGVVIPHSEGQPDAPKLVAAFGPPLPADHVSSSRMHPMLTTVASSAQVAGAGAASSSMVNLTPLPLGGCCSNVNPAMNVSSAPQNVQVTGARSDGPQSLNVLEQLADADTGLLEGIPRGMFDWLQWEQYYARFHLPTENGTGSSGMATFQQPEEDARVSTSNTPHQQQQQQSHENQSRAGQRHYP